MGCGRKCHSLIIGRGKGTDFLDPLGSAAEFGRKYALARRLDDAFQHAYRAEAARAHASALEQAVRLMNAEQKRAFDLSLESARDRERYGTGSFGQGCLMARRLV